MFKVIFSSSICSWYSFKIDTNCLVIPGNSHSSRWHSVGDLDYVGNHRNYIRSFAAKFHWVLVGRFDIGCAHLQWFGHLVWLENCQNPGNARIQMGQHSWYLIDNGQNKACRFAIHAGQLDYGAMAKSEIHVHAIFVGVTIGHILASHRTQHVLFEAYFRNATITPSRWPSLDLYRFDCSTIGEVSRINCAYRCRTLCYFCKSTLSLLLPLLLDTKNKFNSIRFYSISISFKGNTIFT